MGHMKLFPFHAMTKLARNIRLHRLALMVQSLDESYSICLKAWSQRVPTHNLGLISQFNVLFPRKFDKIHKSLGSSRFEIYLNSRWVEIVRSFGYEVRGFLPSRALPDIRPDHMCLNISMARSP